MRAALAQTIASSNAIAARLSAIASMATTRSDQQHRQLERHRQLEQSSIWTCDHASVYTTSMATTRSDQQHDNHWTRDHASVYTTQMATMHSVLIMPSIHATAWRARPREPTQNLAHALLDPTVCETTALTGPRA